MAQAFKKFSTAKALAAGRPIVKIDDLFIVIETDLTAMSIASVELLSAAGRYEATVTLGHLARLGNANYAEARVRYGSGVNPFAKPAKPEICYIVIETNAPGERIGLVKRGEKGFYPTDYDRDSAAIGIVREFVAHMNDKLGVDALEARAMACGSMFGWNVPAANSDHLREARAEAEAIATERGVQ
jgi:hypothetical protein